jgi:hypothetical protein
MDTNFYTIDSPDYLSSCFYYTGSHSNFIRFDGKLYALFFGAFF